MMLSPQHTPTVAVLGDLGWQPVWATAQQAVIRYVAGSLRLPETSLVNQAIRAAVRIGRTNARGAWGTYLRAMLYELGTLGGQYAWPIGTVGAGVLHVWEKTG